jgi:iron(III) transport system ATP-binding protein
VIKVEQLGKSYGKVEALKDASLTVEKGETVGVLGPSGSGKTTLLRLIAGFEQPDKGTITIDDRLASSHEYMLESSQRDISAVFQTPALWPNMTVAKNIEYVQPKPQSELLERTGLSELVDRNPNELSGGESRRVSIVRALAAEKRYLLLDEPLVNLNPELKNTLHEVIIEETKRKGLGVLYISHDESELSYADRRYTMNGGYIGEE